MHTIFARKILRLHAAKIGAGNVIRKRFMTFPISILNACPKIRGFLAPDANLGKLLIPSSSRTLLEPVGNKEAAANATSPEIPACCQLISLANQVRLPAS